jgi:hypothetical protein
MRREISESVGATRRPLSVMVRLRVKCPGTGSGAPSTTLLLAPRKVVDGPPPRTMTQGASCTLNLTRLFVGGSLRLRPTEVRAVLAGHGTVIARLYAALLLHARPATDRVPRQITQPRTICVFRVHLLSSALKYLLRDAANERLRTSERTHDGPDTQRSSAPPALGMWREISESVGATRRPLSVMVRPRVQRPGAGSGAPSTTSPPAPRKVVDGPPPRTMTQGASCTMTQGASCTMTQGASCTMTQGT